MMKYGSHDKGKGGKGKGPYHNGKRQASGSRRGHKAKDKYPRYGSSMKGDPPSR